MKNILISILLSLTAIAAAANPVTSPIFQEHVRMMLKEYIALKSALVTANNRELKSATNRLIKTAQEFDATKLLAEERAFYQTNTQLLINETVAIQQLKDIEQQREHFKNLSNAMVELVKGNNYAAKLNGNTPALAEPNSPVGVGSILDEYGGRKIKLCYCNNAHGYWLSYDDDDAANPYSGK